MVAVSEEKNSFGISSDYNSSGVVGGKEVVQGKKCMSPRAPERPGREGRVSECRDKGLFQNKSYKGYLKSNWHSK